MLKSSDRSVDPSVMGGGVMVTSRMLSKYQRLFVMRISGTIKRSHHTYHKERKVMPHDEGS